MTTNHIAAYAALIIGAAMIGQFAVELGAGRVPIPDSMAWAVPILLAGLQALGAFLPRPGQMDVEKVTIKRETPKEDEP